jgi:IclR family transcriptional regulator, pca regulon regulatory protein
VPVRRYDDAIVGVINIGAYVDRISTDEMIRRLLPLLSEGVAQVRSQLL